MKRDVFVMTLLFCFFISNNLLAELKSTKGNSVNLGVQRAQILPVELPLENRSDDKIKILELITSCNCTSAILQDSILESNSDTNVDVLFDLSKGQGFKNTILNVKYMSESDSEIHILTINLFADVQQAIKVLPIGNTMIQNYPKNVWYETSIEVVNDFEEDIELEIQTNYNKEYCNMVLELDDRITLKTNEKLTIPVKIKINYLYNNEYFTVVFRNKNLDIQKSKMFIFKR